MSAWQEVISPGRFDGQTAIVTGAASGIGRGVVLASDNGWNAV